MSIISFSNLSLLCVLLFFRFRTRGLLHWYMTCFTWWQSVSHRSPRAETPRQVAPLRWCYRNRARTMARRDVVRYVADDTLFFHFLGNLLGILMLTTSPAIIVQMAKTTAAALLAVLVELRVARERNLQTVLSEKGWGGRRWL